MIRLLRRLPFPVRFWAWRLTGYGAYGRARCVACGGYAPIPGLSITWHQDRGPVCYFCTVPGKRPPWWMKLQWPI